MRESMCSPSPEKEQTPRSHQRTTGARKGAGTSQPRKGAGRSEHEFGTTEGAAPPPRLPDCPAVKRIIAQVTDEAPNLAQRSHEGRVYSVLGHLAARLERLTSGSGRKREGAPQRRHMAGAFEG